MTTLDRSSLIHPRRTSPAERLVPCLRVLFHSDLTMVGAELDLAVGSEVVIGRQSPDFTCLDGRKRALGDPFVSREHLRVTLDGRGRTTLSRAAGARMPVELPAGPWSGAGATISVGETPTAVTMGALVALGDRVLLAVTGRPLDALPSLVGRTEAMAHLSAEIRAVASFTEPVLILGETGTGKELVAHAIHDAGRGGPFVALNTAGLDEGTAGSELFGHVRGAFTGAHADRPGVFEAARGGTLFLDEIGDMSLELQRKLLRVLETRRAARIGAREERLVDARFLAATHRPIERDADAGTFRRDLFERLRALPVTVPALRERLLDVPLLFAHFLLAIVSERRDLAWLISPAEGAAPTPIPMSHTVSLLAHSWPGNVRELRNHVTALAAANVRGPPFRQPTMPLWPTTEPGDTPEPQSKNEPRRPAAALPDDETISAALRDAGGRVQDAATRLGCSRFQVYRWLSARGQAPDDFGKAG